MKNVMSVFFCFFWKKGTNSELNYEIPGLAKEYMNIDCYKKKTVSLIYKIYTKNMCE